MSHRYFFALFNLICILSVQIPSTSIAAEEDVQELKPIEVKAARNKLPIENLPTSVTVISNEQIEEKNYINVEEMLREELGMDIVQNGALGSTTSVFMRGAGSNSTLVMVDGIQVNSNTTGSFNFSNILAENIERVEILRGPQSTSWGADAVGGVINLVTKRGKGEPTHSFLFEGGSFSTFKESLSSSGGNDLLDYSVTATRIDSEGISSANENRGNDEEDGYQNTSVSLRTGINFLEDGRFDFIGHYIRSRIEFDDFEFGVGSVDGPPFTRGEQYYIALPLEKRITPWWHVRFNPNYAFDETRARNQTFADTDIFSRTTTLDLQNTFDFLNYFSVVLGGEYQNRNGQSNGTGIDEDLDNRSVYMQAVFDYKDRIVLTGGFRYDDNDPFEDALTYKFEGAYRIKKWGTRLRAAGSTGFRAPTINDLFFPGFSNPDLKPEESTSWEAGFDQTLFDGMVTLSSVYFDSDFENLIQFSLDTFMPENVAKAKSKGVETTLKVLLPYDFTLKVNHTWNDTFDLETKRRLRRRAEHKFHTNIQHNWKDKVTSLLGITYKSNTEDGASGNTDPYVVLRGAVQYKLNRHIKLTLRGENLLDEEYEEVVGFGTPGAAAYAGFVLTY